MFLQFKHPENQFMTSMNFIYNFFLIKNEFFNKSQTEKLFLNVVKCLFKCFAQCSRILESKIQCFLKIVLIKWTSKIYPECSLLENLCEIFSSAWMKVSCWTDSNLICLMFFRKVQIEILQKYRLTCFWIWAVSDFLGVVKYIR